MNAIAGWLPMEVMRQFADGSCRMQSLCVADERPVAIGYNGVAHAVMMATPADLEDFAVGFSLTEGIADASGIRGIVAEEQGSGEIALDVALEPIALHRFLARRRVRNRVGHGGCGVCGVEDFADALPMPAVPIEGVAPVDPGSVVRAVAALRDFQPLASQTHATHAAAFASADGVIRLIREDVGRHNAMDKLIGARARLAAVEPGFCVVTSRCSVELVQKAAIAGIRTLVAVSAPTMMAIDWARRAGMTLIATARGDGFTVFTGV